MTCKEKCKKINKRIKKPNHPNPASALTSFRSFFSSSNITNRIFSIVLGIGILICVHIVATHIRHMVIRMFQRQTKNSMLIISEEGVVNENTVATKPSNNMVYGFIGSLVYWGILLIGLVIVLKLFGVETTSLIALLGTAGFAAGLAMQGVLNDLSSGILLTIGGDFGIGDLIEVEGIKGTVYKFNLLYTTILHNDTYHMVKIPNRQVYGTILQNHTKLPRSVVITIMVGNNQKILVDNALRQVERGLKTVDGVIAVPPPHAQISKVHAFGTDIEVRVSIRPELYPNAKNYNFVNQLTSYVRQILIENGLTMGSPYYATPSS